MKCLINYKDIQRNEKLGEGGFGVVYKGKWQATDVAIKELRSDSSLPRDAYEAFKKEAEIMHGLRHPNIVQFLGYSEAEGATVCIVMEYMPQGSLYHYLHNREPINWDIRLKISTDISQGLVYLHSNNILHRDIKSLNVLLNGNIAKLTDFGLSKIKTHTSITRSTATLGNQVGTTAWMAPELFKRERYTNKSDVYSLGIVFWEVASRQIPFADVAADVLIPGFVLQGFRPEPEIPESCPSFFTTLTHQCWDQEPIKRPDARFIAATLSAKQEELDTNLPIDLQGSYARSSSEISTSCSSSGLPILPLYSYQSQQQEEIWRNSTAKEQQQREQVSRERRERAEREQREQQAEKYQREQAVIEQRVRAEREKLYSYQLRLEKEKKEQEIRAQEDLKRKPQSEVFREWWHARSNGISMAPALEQFGRSKNWEQSAWVVGRQEVSQGRGVTFSFPDGSTTLFLHPNGTLNSNRLSGYVSFNSDASVAKIYPVYN